MRTAQEIALVAMVADGWAEMSDGDVESPAGYFAVVPVDGTEEAHQYSTGDEDADAWLYEAERGYYFALQDSLGFVYVAGPMSRNDALADYRAHEATFEDWMQS